MNRTSEAGRRADVIIAGGGLVGLAAGVALARCGLETIVVDASPASVRLDAAYDGRASAIAYANFRMLKRLGVAERLGEVQPIERILVSDGRAPDGLRAGGPGPFLLRFDASETGAGGEPLGYMVENRRMRAALTGAAEATSGLTLIAPAKVETVTIDGPVGRIRLESGETLHAALIVGAEGARSKVRDAMGVRVHGWRYRQAGVVATVRCDAPHDGVAHEYFLPSGPFAILPLTENRANLVWTERTEAANAVAALDDAAFLAEVRRRFGGFLGDLALTGPRFVYPLELSLAERFVAPRAALVGDAARRIHPIAGQGFNLGLKDAAALADVLSEARLVGLDLGALDVLEGYQRWRRFDSVTMAAATDAFVRLFSNDLAPMRLARGLGMAAVDAAGLARRVFARTAGADVGDQPSLLRADPGETALEA